MSRVYLLNYNNYGNRIIKRESSLANYLLADPTYKMYSDINFYRNDGVNTRQTINIAAAESEKNADYLIVTDNSGNIVSRWFIIECNFNRKNQMILTLRRDLIVDFLNDIKSQSFYCEKGVVPFSTGLRSIICQPESTMQFNQVLTKKTNIEYGTANGIYGYIDRSYNGNKIAMNIDTMYFNSEDELPIKDLIGTVVTDGPSASVGCVLWAFVNNNSDDLTPAPGWYCKETITSTGATSATPEAVFNKCGSAVGSDRTLMSDVQSDFHSAISPIYSEIYNDLQSQFDKKPYNRVSPYIGRHIMIGDKLYTVSLTNATNVSDILVPSRGTFSSIRSKFVSSTHFYWKILGEGTTDNESSGIFYKTSYQKYTVSLVADTSTDTFSLSNASTRTHCGKPYDIFYMPWSTTAQQIASVISARLYSSGALYDIQRLPYRAPSSIQGTSQSITYSGTSVTLYWLNLDEFSATSTSTESEWGTSAYDTTLNAKVGACCDTLRIVSPNRANSWDFNPAQTGGVAGWYIRCTLKPFQPYIHIRPYLNGLYNGTGTTNYAYNNDPRGLICGGSFSFPLVSDKWANYQINNSAYFNSFERDIENMSTVQDAQRTLQKWQIAAGTVSGATMGAYAGNNIGGGVGAAIGGVAAGVGSLIAGIADYEINEKLRNEAIDYKRDQFGYSLQNLIAAPRTLARTDAFDIDWNGFPYVEYYTATAAEKEMLKRKIRYNGMSLNALSDPAGSTYITGGLITLLNNANGSTISTYVKGKLIRFGGKDDTHVFNEIANELYKGIYWQGGTVT